MVQKCFDKLTNESYFLGVLVEQNFLNKISLRKRTTETMAKVVGRHTYIRSLIVIQYAVTFM